MTNWAWAGGFLDGEGCFKVDKKGTVRVSAAQKFVGPLEALQSIAGGKIYYRRDGYYEWNLQRKVDTCRLVSRVQPYLRSNKRPQAELIQRYWEGQIPRSKVREQLAAWKRREYHPD